MIIIAITARISKETLIELFHLDADFMVERLKSMGYKITPPTKRK